MDRLFAVIDDLWLWTFEFSGFEFYEQHKFRRYFRNCAVGYAFKFGKVTKFEPEKSLVDFGLKRAPQNFQYLPDKPQEADT